MLISPELLEKYNNIRLGDDPAARELVRVHIGAAQAIISDYVGFDCEEAVSKKSRYTEPQKELFRQTALRIATLLMEESGGNIGVSSMSAEASGGRAFLNVVDYTPYLKLLSAFRRNGGVW